MQLFELAAYALALEVREVVDEQLAVQVIEFVLDAHREQAIGMQLTLLATLDRTTLDMQDRWF